MKKKASTLRHQAGAVCGLCEAKLLTAHNDLAKWFRAAKAKWKNLHISWAFRSQKDQDKAVADGASELNWPNSPHNNMVDGIPTSLALDIFQIDEDGIARFQYAFNKVLWIWTLNTFGAKNMVWGGTFRIKRKSGEIVSDSGHFELRPTSKQAIH